MLEYIGLLISCQIIISEYIELLILCQITISVRIGLLILSNQHIGTYWIANIIKPAYRNILDSYYYQTSISEHIGCKVYVCVCMYMHVYVCICMYIYHIILTIQYVLLC